MRSMHRSQTWFSSFLVQVHSKQFKMICLINHWLVMSVGCFHSKPNGRSNFDKVSLRVKVIYHQNLWMNLIQVEQKLMNIVPCARQCLDLKNSGAETPGSSNCCGRIGSGRQKLQSFSFVAASERDRGMPRPDPHRAASTARQSNGTIAVRSLGLSRTSWRVPFLDCGDNRPGNEWHPHCGIIGRSQSSFQFELLRGWLVRYAIVN